MSNNIQPSSREAYRTILPGTELNSIRRRQVLTAIREIGPCSDKEISEYTGMPINTVTPRRGELVNSGHIFAKGRAKNSLNISVIQWQIAPQEGSNAA